MLLTQEDLIAIIKNYHILQLGAFNLDRMTVWFRTLNEVRALTENWITEYNEERPHDAQNALTPWEYLTKHDMAETSNYGCN